VYFYVMASVEAHKIPAQKAWLVFGILGAVMYVAILASGIADYSYRKRLDMQSVEMQKEMKEMQKKLEEMQKQR
jgi:type III secretory pathway component EscU